MGSGIFIAVEGVDGSGKSTIAKLLSEKIAATGRVVYDTAEPSTGAIGRIIRGHLVNRDLKEPPDPWMMALLFAADRRDHLVNEIVPAIRRGFVVISDRYVLSSLTYQPQTGVSREEVVAMNAHALTPTSRSSSWFPLKSQRAVVRRGSAARSSTMTRTRRGSWRGPTTSRSTGSTTTRSAPTAPSSSPPQDRSKKC